MNTNRKARHVNDVGYARTSGKRRIILRQIGVLANESWTRFRAFPDREGREIHIRAVNSGKAKDIYCREFGSFPEACR